LDYFTGIGTKNRECSGTMQGTNRDKPITKAYLLIIFKYVGHNFSIIPLTDSVAKIGKNRKYRTEKRINERLFVNFRLIQGSFSGQ